MWVLIDPLAVVAALLLAAVCGGLATLALVGKKPSGS
jgi:hypothetical protein